jgi:hypothetical protein
MVFLESSTQVLTHIFSYLETPKELGACAFVNSEWHEQSKASWNDIANARYGASIVRESLALYQNDLIAMLKDDNVLGAWPSLPVNQIIGDAQSGYVRIDSIQWVRTSNEIRVYAEFKPREINILHAENNSRLPPPRRQPSMFCQYRSTSTGVDVPCVWNPENENSTKGYYSFTPFPVSRKRRPIAGYSRYYYFWFTLENGSHWRVVVLPDVISEDNRSLEMVFGSKNGGKLQFSKPQSPFYDDTPETEAMRWRMPRNSVTDTARTQRRAA